jgi:hypothetical protein
LQALPWSVPVALEDIPETGQHFDLVADEATRAGVARAAGLREVDRLEARFDVTRYGAGGLRVVGCVSATVGQTCVVTLEPLANEVEEDVDLVFLPGAAATRAGRDIAAPEGPEPLIDGKVDLGALATEFVILGLDPYPRQPGAVFAAPPAKEPAAGAFAALAKLKGDQERNGG